MTSTIYDSVAPSRVFKTCFVHSRGPSSWNWCAKISELTTSGCSISQTLRTNAFVNLGGFPLRTAINWSHSSLHTPAVHYIVNWPPFIAIWSYSHPIACCCPSLLRAVLHNYVKCASCAMFSAAAIAASWWTKFCLRCSCASASAHRSARFGLNHTWPRCLWSHDLLLWKRWGRW
jgi:hypothetical protein